MALNSIMSNLPMIGFRNVKPLELAILQDSEDSDDALKIMADVRAYFQGMWLAFLSYQIKIIIITTTVSFKRFVDNTVKAIDEELVLGLSNGLQKALMSGLKLDSPDAHETCARLIADQPYIAEKRKSLAAKKEKLLLAQGELDELYNVLAWRKRVILGFCITYYVLLSSWLGCAVFHRSSIAEIFVTQGL
jgi:hypothetical protein